MSRFREGMVAIKRAVLGTPGDSTLELRRTVYDGGDVEEPLAAYVETITRHAYRITDETIEELQAAGYSEDAIFELTLAAATKECLRRYEIGTAALR